MIDRELAQAEPGYEPLDLSALCNAPSEILYGQAPALSGYQEFHGVPFRLGRGDGIHRHLLIGEDYPDVAIPVAQLATGLVVAHRISERRPGRGGPPGEPVARYRVLFADGRELVNVMRRRFEIDAASADHWDFDQPFNAWISSEVRTAPQEAGPWHDVGKRQSEAWVELPPSYILWYWRNPFPETLISEIHLEGDSLPVLIGGITITHLDETPFSRAPAMTLAVSQESDTGLSLEHVSVKVDRGAATYLYPRTGMASESLLGDALRGWGVRGREQGPVHGYARVSAVPSASIQLETQKQVLAEVAWSELEDGHQALKDGWAFQIVDMTKNWTRITVVDDDTGEPTPCRIHLHSGSGVPYQPSGHDNHVAFDQGSWNVDVGGDVKLGVASYDVKLGVASYAAIDGVCEGWLPQGEVFVDIARGFEYQPIRQWISIHPGQRELIFRLKRWIDMAAIGWYSGDSHVHFLSPHASLREQMAEDLNVVNLLASQWGHFFTGAEEFTGHPLVHISERYISYVSQENRQHLLGHLVLWGLKSPVLPYCADGLSEAELGGALETTLSDWADRCHDQDGTVVIAHLPRPNGETAALVATGRADAVEMIIQTQDAHKAYYDILNCGYRMPLVGGTDKMSADVPVGLYRTYAYLGDTPFSFDAWQAAVRAGRTFMSSGPMIGLTVNAAGPGDVVDAVSMVTINAWADGVLPFQCLEVIKNGTVIGRAHRADPDQPVRIEIEVNIDEDSWIVARCGGAKYFDGPRHMDVWERAIFAHTSPVYVCHTSGGWRRYDPRVAREMLIMITGALEYMDNIAVLETSPDTVHHHGLPDHEAFLRAPLLEAQSKLKDRAKAWGDDLEGVLGHEVGDT